MRRLLALGLAVAMVAGALFVRQRLEDDDGGGSGPGGGNGDDGSTLLVCATELAVACKAVEEAGFEVRVEPAGVTAEALAAGEVDLDGWLTIAPWPAIVAEARQRAGGSPVLDETDLPPLARTPLVIVAVKERMAVLRDPCGDNVHWRCIGDVAGRRWEEVGGRPTWGEVRPGHDPPDTSATGLLILGSAVVDFFGTADISSADFEDDGFRTWFARLERAVPSFRPRFESLVDDLILTPDFDAIGALEADAAVRLDRAGARGDRLVILYPSPMTTADAVLALPPGREGGSLAQKIDSDGVAALVEAGWRTDSTGLPEAAGLPPAGVLDALRGLWTEVAG